MTLIIIVRKNVDKIDFPLQEVEGIFVEQDKADKYYEINNSEEDPLSKIYYETNDKDIVFVPKMTEEDLARMKYCRHPKNLNFEDLE